MTDYVYSPSLKKRIAVETLNPSAKPSKRRQREIDTFVKVPLRWVKTASEAGLSGSALAVLILLMYMAWQARSSTFTCPNGLMERHGISREVKRRALVKLEATGFITVQREARHSPIISLKL